MGQYNLQNIHHKPSAENRCLRADINIQETILVKGLSSPYFYKFALFSRNATLFSPVPGILTYP